MNKVKKIVFSLLFLFVFATSAILFGCEQKDPVTEEVPSNIDSETSIDKTEPGEDDVPQTITVPEDIDEPKDDPVSFLATAFISRHSSLLIKAFDSVAIADCQAIVDAISDFDELELAVKELLAEEKLLVDSFEDKIGKLEEEIDTVKMLIGLLSDEASTFEADLKAARMAYNALTVEQQNFVNNYSNLLESESTSRVKNVITIIARVVDSGNPSVECIAEAMTAYEKLTNLEKARIVNFSDLLEAEVSVTAQLDQTLANVVVSFIDELDHETGDFFDKVVAARSAYNSLTAARQVLVVNLTALEEAENLILASEAFIDAVKLIPYNLELTDKSQIIHAREIYDVLPTKVAELFSIKVQLDVLQNAENAIAALEIILQQAIDQFEEENAYALGLTVDSIMIEDKAAVTLAVTSYESLSIAVQETLSEKKAHLDNLLGVIESVEDFLRRFSNILVLTEEEVTLSHKSIVDSAFLTYEFLSENAKTLLANEFAHLNIIKEKVTLLEVVDGFKAWHSNVLSSSVETIKFADKADLQEALHAYNRLDASAKALLVNEKELLDRLNTQMTFLERAAEFVYANLYVLSLTDEIETEETATASDKAAVKDALIQYDRLDERVQSLLTIEKEILDNLIALFEVEEAIQEFFVEYEDLLSAYSLRAENVSAVSASFELESLFEEYTSKKNAEAYKAFSNVRNTGTQYDLYHIFSSSGENTFVVYVNGTDAITEIIPTHCFQNEGIYSYFGENYGFWIRTVSDGSVNVSNVMVFKIVYDLSMKAANEGQISVKIEVLLNYDFLSFTFRTSKNIFGATLYPSDKLNLFLDYLS